jgi:methionyl aminopeptidase
MSVIIKTPPEIALMRVAGQLTGDVLSMIGEHVKIGVSTAELDKICHDYIVDQQQAYPASLNYMGFPKSVCTSVNHVVCHGIPGDRKLKNGDIVNIDVTVKKDDFIGDTSKMFIVGNGSIKAKHVTRISHECLWLGIDLVKPGIQLGDIGAVIQTHAEKNRCSVVREYCGHGIGRRMHEAPQVLHYGKPGTGLALEPGMIFTIEPMVNSGKAAVKMLKDNWTVVTKDRELSAQWEHTILVTDSGHEVLTLREEEKNA